jgi:hypothetical protein
MPKIPEPLPTVYNQRWTDFFLNELNGFYSAGTPYELWWAQARPLDVSLDLTGRGSFATVWPDLMTTEVPLSEILQRFLVKGGQVHVICEPFSQAFTRSDILAGPEALVNRVRLAFSESFQVHIIPAVAPPHSGWVGHWGAVVGSPLPAPFGDVPQYVAQPDELERLRARYRALAEGRATAAPELPQRRITTGELDMMRALIRRSGRYVDVERLPQQTGRSLLYRATDTHAGDEIVVIKVTLGTALDAERARSREAVARRLGHPNIVRIYDPENFNIDDQQPLFAVVMEYMPGGSLKDELDRHGRLPLRRTVEIAIQACRGLAYAHDQGIVHRDIKPGNILLGAHDEVKVADFNIAKIPALSGETVPGMPVGTFDYIPPEQIERAHQATPRADVYSLGCVLFEMLAGRPPFSGDTERELAMHHTNTPPPSVCTYRPEVPASLDDLIQRCLSKEPAERPSADELAEALLSILAQLPQEEV